MIAQHCHSSGVQFDCHALAKHVIQIQGGYLTTPPAGFQRQLTSCQENSFRSFLTGPDNLSYTLQTPVLDATRLRRTDERNNLALEHDWTDFDCQGQWPLQFGGNEVPQASDCKVVWSWSIPSNRAADLSTSWPIIDTSPESLAVGPLAATYPFGQDLTDINPQGLSGGNEYLQPDNSSGAVGSPTSWSIIDSLTQSHVEPSEARHLLSQGLTDINPYDLSKVPLDKSEHSQPGNVLSPLLILPRGEAGPPTSSTTTTASSTQSLLEPSEVGPHVTAEDDLRSVGSPQIQQAAARRRKKGGIHQCPFANCNATFTELHNLRYHKNSHLGLKPYKCSTCEFAAASPATLRRHMKRHQSSCKDTGHTIEGKCEPESSSIL